MRGFNFWSFLKFVWIFASVFIIFNVGVFLEGVFNGWSLWVFSGLFIVAFIPFCLWLLKWLDNKSVVVDPVKDFLRLSK